MKRPGVWIAGGLAVIVPAAVWYWGQATWAWGLWLGLAAGTLSFVWVRLSLRQIFGAGSGLGPWWLHSAARIAVITGVLFLAFYTGKFSVWALLLGYTAAHWSMATRQLAIPALAKR